MKRLLVLWLLSYPVTQLLSLGSAFAFSDVSEDYVYYDSIQSLKDLKIVQGYSDDTYRPEAPVTRAELLKMMVESFPDAFGEDCAFESMGFWDVGEGRWFTDYICKANKAGFVSGYPDGMFRPGQFINVAELSKIVSRLKGVETLEGDPWFEGYIGHLEAWHYLLPTFVTPSDLVNRGEMAEMINRLNRSERSRWFSAYDTTHQKFVPQTLGPLTKLPWKLNLEMLSRMRLEGKDFTIGRTIFQNSRYKTHEITYLSNGIRITGLMNVPNGVGPFPVLILAHGYYPDDVYQTGTGLKREQDYFVRNGFVTIHPDYRGYAGSEDDPENRGLYDGAMGYTIDVINLVEALKGTELSFIDKNQFMIFGHSMGGGIALNIVTMLPRLFDGAVLYAPSGGNAWDNYQRWWKDRAGTDWSQSQWKDYEANPWSWNQISSKHFLDRIEVPVYIFHGNKDGENIIGVPVEWSDQLAISLRDLAKQYQYFRYHEQGHVFVGHKWLEMVAQSKELFQSK